MLILLGLLLELLENGKTFADLPEIEKQLLFGTALVAVVVVVVETGILRLAVADSFGLNGPERRYCCRTKETFYLINFPDNLVIQTAR